MSEYVIDPGAPDLVIRADVVDVARPEEVTIERRVLEVRDGGIERSHRPGAEADGAIVAGRRNGTLIDAAPGTFLLPGLIDLHVHAPQWPQLGTGLDLPLEQWLFEHTFPLEARYVDLDFAGRVWASLVDGLLSGGTTTAVMFASRHEPATELLATVCRDQGLRAFIGRVAMDHPEGTPEWYRDPSAAEGVDASARSIEAIRRIDPSGRVAPIVTPRFVPACTDALLDGLGELAAATRTPVQTHCSESDWEHEYVIDRFDRTDTDVLTNFGLVRAHTVLAHADHVTDSDLAVVAEHRAGIAHCPLSNSYFGDAVFPVRRAIERRVNVGLGTDVAGGAHPGLLHQAAMAVTASRMLESGVDPALAAHRRGRPGSRIDATTALWLATTGGAEVLGLPLGRLIPGRRFDAVLLDPGRVGSLVTRWPEVDDDARVVEKLVRLGGGPNVAALWIEGRRLR